MRRYPHPLMALGFAAILLLGACAHADETPEAVSHAAEPIDAHQCSACGMTVSEQPAPRAQVVHRDGTRLYFCAIGDLIAHLAAPSPHGAVEAIFVETLPDDANATERETGVHPWQPAAGAAYVVGVRRRVMGAPVLIYATQAAAEAAAGRHEGARALDWNSLLDWFEEEEGIRVPR